MPGGLAWFADDSIPTLGTSATTQVIVARPSTIVVWEGAPIPVIAPEPGAATLSVIVWLRAYVAAIPRYPRAISSISGSAYAGSLT
jgi:hypothetical protein